MSWLPKRTVAVPVDFSEQSIAAVDLALGLVEDTSNVHVIHVLAPLLYTDYGWPAIDEEARCRHAAPRLADHRPRKREGPTAVGGPLGRRTEDPGHQRGTCLT